MNNLMFLVLILFLPLLSGCNTTGNNFSDIGAYVTGTEVTLAQMNSVIDGKSIKKDIIQNIGHPNRKDQVNSKEIWYYDYTKIRHIGNNVSESTVFEFDRNGRLTSHYKTGNSGRSSNPLLGGG